MVQLSHTLTALALLGVALAGPVIRDDGSGGVMTDNDFQPDIKVRAVPTLSDPTAEYVDAAAGNLRGSSTVAPMVQSVAPVVEDENGLIAKLQRQIKELQARLQELEEELEHERSG
ncbi:hypothetical protein C8F04DRAFT_1189033 [Mycena alexandri]|uniref:Uncharacterized protein n=1 Tax=Mycena alexandri TaxID=1745969 RepID=A0AAD6SIE2_9AGAR|nr:hypothetical protein C8F04DRAFT_1189033 [Mycena alexandri]